MYPSTPCSLALEKDQVLHPYKTIRKIMVGLLDVPHNLWVWVRKQETTEKKTAVDTFFKDSICAYICKQINQTATIYI
jgi:hypothetical protein